MPMENKQWQLKKETKFWNQLCIKVPSFYWRLLHYQYHRPVWVSSPITLQVTDIVIGMRFYSPNLFKYSYSVLFSFKCVGTISQRSTEFDLKNVGQQNPPPPLFNKFDRKASCFKKIEFEI